jgi:hypothetical protein
MEQRISGRRRFVLAMLTCTVLLSGAQMAKADDPDPTNVLIDTLLPVTDVIATGISPTQIFVSWKSPMPLATMFRIQMSFSQFGEYVDVATAPGCGPDTKRGLDPVCMSAFETGPPSDPTPRWIRVVPILAVNGTGIDGVDGTELVPGHPSQADPAVLSPPPPTDLKCNGDGPSSTACFNVADVELTWTDNSDEQEFWVMRAPNSNQPCKSKPFGTSPHAMLAANKTKFNENIPEFNAVYYYKVVAVRVQSILKVVDGIQKVVDERSYSDSVNPDCIKVITPPKKPPTAPTGLTGTLVPPRTVHLAWTDLEPNPAETYIEEDGFFIEIGSSSDGFEVLTARPRHEGQGTVEFNHDIPTDVTKCFRVRSYRNGPAYSKFTNSVCLGSIPLSPSALTAKAISNARVDLTWTDRSNTETQFLIERCTGICLASSAGWAVKDSVPANTVKYSDESTVASTTYSYRVRAKNDSGSSGTTNISTVTTPVAPVARPTGLAATATGSHQITLNWVDNADDETGYRVEYHDRYSDWGTLVNLGVNAHHWVDEDGLGANHRRWYRVRATKNTAVSDPSDVADATTSAPEAPNGLPTDLVATAHDNVSIDIDWKDNATNEDYYKIEYLSQIDKDCSAAVVIDDSVPRSAFKSSKKVSRGTGTGAMSTRIGGLIPHTAHWFRIYAVNQDGEKGPGTLETQSTDHKYTTLCVNTKGPAGPVFIDPADDGDTSATRCDVTLYTLASDSVDRLRYIVNAVISGGIASTDVQYYDRAAPTPSRFTLTSVTVKGVDYDKWKIKYDFRKGPNYRLIATSYTDYTVAGNPNPVRYFGPDTTRYDVKVLADCPIRPDPIEP